MLANETAAEASEEVSISATPVEARVDKSFGKMVMRELRDVSSFLGI